MNQKNLSAFIESLFQILYNGNGFSDMLKLAEEYLENPVFLYDINYNLIGASPAAQAQQSHIRRGEKRAYLSDSEVERMKQHDVLGDLSRHTSAFYAEDRDHPGIIWLFCAVRIRGNFIGYLISPSHGQMAEFELSVMTELARAVSVELQKNDMFPKKIGMRHAYFLINLINGDFENESMILSRAEILEQPIQKYIHIICISQEEKKDDISYHPSIIEQCRNCFSYVVSAVYNKNLILLVSSQNSEAEQPDYFHDFMSFLHTHHLKAGVSQEYCRIVTSPAAFHAALNALKIGSRLQPADSLFFAKHFLFYQLLESCGTQLIQSSLYRPYLQIKQYDAEHGSDFLKTLQAFFACGRKPGETSESLHIHRTTLFYRFKNIEEMWHLSLSDPDTLFALELSFKMNCYLEKL